MERESHALSTGWRGTLSMRGFARQAGSLADVALKTRLRGRWETQHGNLLSTSQRAVGEPTPPSAGANIIRQYRRLFQNLS
jgi:hypothetical protein